MLRVRVRSSCQECMPAPASPPRPPTCTGSGRWKPSAAMSPAILLLRLQSRNTGSRSCMAAGGGRAAGSSRVNAWGGGRAGQLEAGGTAVVVTGPSHGACAAVRNPGLPCCQLAPCPILLMARFLGCSSWPPSPNAFSSKKKETAEAESRKYVSVLAVWLRVLKTEMVAGSKASTCGGQGGALLGGNRCGSRRRAVQAAPHQLLAPLLQRRHLLRGGEVLQHQEPYGSAAAVWW